MGLKTHFIPSRPSFPAHTLPSESTTTHTIHPPESLGFWSVRILNARGGHWYGTQMEGPPSKPRCNVACLAAVGPKPQTIPCPASEPCLSIQHSGASHDKYPPIQQSGSRSGQCSSFFHTQFPATSMPFSRRRRNLLSDLLHFFTMPFLPNPNPNPVYLMSFTALFN